MDPSADEPRTWPDPQADDALEALRAGLQRVRARIHAFREVMEAAEADDRTSDGSPPEA